MALKRRKKQPFQFNLSSCCAWLRFVGKEKRSLDDEELYNMHCAPIDFSIYVLFFGKRRNETTNEKALFKEMISLCVWKEPP